MKKTVNFRFATGTLDRLEKLAEGSTRTAVLERLILDASKGVRVDRERAVQEKLVRASGLPANKPIGTPARRKLNPMTGKPFGAVPK